MKDAEQFNLINVASIVKDRRWFIFSITAICALVAGGLSLLRPKNYEAKAEFFLRNPYYNDRNVLFGQALSDYSFYANDADLSRLQTLVQADKIQQEIISRYGLAAVYEIDTADPRDMEGLRKLVSRNLRIWRTDNKSVELAYVDKDPVRAARIANTVLTLLEQHLQDFYQDTKWQMRTLLLDKITEEDSSIAALTDTLVKLREQYGIYDIISPARSNLIMSGNSDKGRAGFARGLEIIQNIESVKDQLVVDRARHLSIANEYNTRQQHGEFSLIRVVRQALPTYKPVGLGVLLTTIAGAVAGFCCAVLMAMIYRLF